MQESWDFKIVRKKSEENPKSILMDVLKKEKKDLGIFLSYYFKMEGAVVENVSLFENIDFKDRLKGSFKVEFDLVHHNACLNIHEENKEKLELQFEFDQNLESLTLIGPLRLEREPDDI
jgi:hypothetical protein